MLSWCAPWMAILLNLVDCESVLISRMHADHLLERRPYIRFVSVSYPPMTQKLAHVRPYKINVETNKS